MKIVGHNLIGNEVFENIAFDCPSHKVDNINILISKPKEKIDLFSVKEEKSRDSVGYRLDSFLYLSTQIKLLKSVCIVSSSVP